MDIKFHGGNCLSLTVKKAVLMIDAGEKGVEANASKAQVHLATMTNFAPNKTDGFEIDGPGEYEVAGFSVTGIPARANMDEEGKQNATIYTIVVAGYKLLVLGHVDPNLTDKQLEEIGMVDIAFVPVGGNGFSMDGVSAAKVITKIEPKIVIPTHYKMSDVNYEVPQDSLESFVKEIGATPEKQDKLKLKNGIVPDNLTVIELGRS